MESAFRLFFDTLDSIFRGTPLKNEEYKADFASPSTLLSSRERGFCLTGQNISVERSFSNALVCAQTGGGKSSVVLINSLLTMDGSFIVNDPSGELFNKTAGALFQKNYLVKVLNFSNPSASCGYNPVIRANTSTGIQKLAHILITGGLGNNKGDKFWDNSAISLLVLLIRVLKLQDACFQNLYNVLHLVNCINGNPELVDSLFSGADDALYTAYKSFLESDQRLTSGILASVKAALVIYNDEAVAQVTSTDTLNMEEFREKKVVLYVQNSVADASYFSSLLNVFYEQFFAFILSYIPKKEEQPVFFLLDEASSVRPIILPMALANCRKSRCGILLAVQDTAQLAHNFGKNEAASIITNCVSKIFIGTQTYETAAELSRILGRFEFLDKQERKVIRELMTPDEIIRMKPNTGLILSGSNPPILAPLVPYYANWRRRALTRIPPPKIVSDIPGISSLACDDQ